MNRVYLLYIGQYLNKKIAIISGPRQSGKTTLTKMLSTHFDYLNYDNEEDRDIIKSKSWNRKNDLIIFDELHKKPKWKQWLKGIFDVEGVKPHLVVTGSARIDTYKKIGDSLAGRYFNYRVHPFDIRELTQLKYKLDHMAIIERLLTVGGFPEPFLDGSQKFYNLWKKTHLDIILRQDLIDFETLRNIKQLELLIDLLRDRVGSPISYSSLAEDLQVSDKTIKKWLEILENMFIIFKITPYSKNVARSVLKRPKYYFYDIARVRDAGAKLENLVAASLLKEVQFRQDCLGEEWDLFYLSKKGGHEIDFLITKKESAYCAIEVKTSDNSPSKNFNLFAKELVQTKKIQLVHNLKREKTFPNGVEITSLGKWLASWK